MDFGERVKKRREELKLSQTELASKVGLTSAAAISLIEKGDRKPSFDLLSKLADALEVTTDFLMGRDSTNDKLQIAFRGAGELKPEFQDMLKDYVDLLRNSQKKGEKE
jgi:transcriptional regulator with XRE-family HTH domain